MIDSAVLVLNRSFLPIHVTTVRRAFTLLYQGVAKAVNEQYQTFNFNDWSELRPREHEDAIGVVGGWIKVPRVILLVAYDRLPKRHVRFSRYNIFMRDKNSCQYCGRMFPRRELNLDHVIPRSRGGLSTWENIVCSCHACNRRKGGKTPVEASMRLIRPPRKPRWTPYLGFHFEGGVQYREWQPFLNFVDVSYWNTELLE